MILNSEETPNNYSVLMSVYAKEKPEYLQLAMDSIWKQTVPTNNFILVCDGPLTDELNAVIRKMELLHPTELCVARLDKNYGLGYALNIGLKHCKNELVARMDSDDISRLDRCEKQLLIFTQMPNLDICSGTIEEFRDSLVSPIGMRKLPETDKNIRSFSKKRNPFNHPAVMFRKSVVESAGGYNEQFHLFEDYSLWIRMLQNGAVGYNIQEPLLFMRTPSDLYIRRGQGGGYVTDMLRFHRWLVSIHWTSWIDYLLGAVPHAMVCILPNFIRELVYRKMLRS